MGYVKHFPERSQSQTNTDVTHLHRQVVDIHGCDRSVGLGDLELMYVIDPNSSFTEDGITVFRGRESDANTTIRNKLDRQNLFKVRLFGQHLHNDVGRHCSHHAMSMNDYSFWLRNWHCIDVKLQKTIYTSQKKTRPK